MDLRTFLQLLFIVTSGASTFGVWLAWASRKNGKETRAYLGELINKIDERAEQGHREIIEISQQQHREVIQLLDKMTELLNKGFGDLNTDMSELKNSR